MGHGSHIVEGFKYLASVLRILWSSRGWRCWRSSSHPFSSLLLQLLHLLEDHLLIPGIAHCLNTVLLQFSLELFTALEELPFLALVLLLNCGQLCLQLFLVHCETLNLPPQHLQIFVI